MPRAYFTRHPRRDDSESGKRPPVAHEVWVVSVGKDPVMCLTDVAQSALVIAHIMQKYKVPQHLITVVKVPVVL